MKKFLTAIYIVRNRKPEKNEITESLRIFDTEQNGMIDVVNLR